MHIVTTVWFKANVILFVKTGAKLDALREDGITEIEEKREKTPLKYINT